MPDKLDNAAPFNDEQGTKIPGKSTGAGAEATEGIRNKDNADDNSEQHLSKYGGSGTKKPKKY